MAETGPTGANQFAIQKQSNDPTRQPLEVYHLSHDLRGPLNSMLGFTELLLEGIEGPLNDIQKEDIAAIRQSAQNLLRLINTVVDLSKLEADKLTLNFQPVELSTIIQKISAVEFEAVKPDGVELVTQVPESLPPLRADRDRLQQMVINLINFALSIQTGSRIELAAAHDEQHATVRVTAAGASLPPAHLAELFELAVKLDSAGRSELGRGGLALPLTEKLARLHQGQVWAENDADGGVSLYLKLPLHQEN